MRVSQKSFLIQYISASVNSRGSSVFYLTLITSTSYLKPSASVSKLVSLFPTGGYFLIRGMALIQLKQDCYGWGKNVSVNHIIIRQSRINVTPPAIATHRPFDLLFVMKNIIMKPVRGIITKCISVKHNSFIKVDEAVKI